MHPSRESLSNASIFYLPGNTPENLRLSLHYSSFREGSYYTGLRVQAVLDDFHEIAGYKQGDFDCLFAVFLYEFIADCKRDSWLDRFSVSMKISSSLRKELAAFMGKHDG